MSKTYYSISQAASLLEVSPPTLSKHIKSGELKVARLPGSDQPKIHHNDLVEFGTRYGFQGLHKIVEPLITAQGSTAEVVSDVRLLLRVLANRPDFDPRSIADVIPRGVY
jgi:excisionase family DNA binding protein